MSDKPQTTPPNLAIPTIRMPEFVSRYSNNIRFESYGMDLKLIFGQSDQASGSEVIEQHTAITLSWAQIKLAIYYLQVQLMVYEGQTQKPVSIHPVSIPAAFPNEPPAEVKSDPHAKETLEKLRQLREEFIASLP